MQPREHHELHGTNSPLARHRIVSLPDTARKPTSQPGIGSIRHKAGLPPRCLLQWLTAAVLLYVVRITAADPIIDAIDLLGTNYVTIHFDTAPNRTYALQYTTNPPFAKTTNWFDLYVAPNLPSPSHYVIVDYRTNQMRFYRLKVTP